MPELAAPDTILPVLNLRAEAIPERVLVVGDPARAALLAERLDGAAELGRNREYASFGGTYRGVPVAVVSHGVGSPGAALCFDELCRGGARRIVRAGTCGGLQPEVRDGALVIATAAVRDDGYSTRVLPIEYPAVASVDVVVAARQAMAAVGVDAFEGVVLSSDLFYAHDVLGNQLARWGRAGAVAVEMECSALFTVATLYRISAGAVLAADGNPLAQDDDDMSGYDPHRQVVADAIDTMITVALETLVADA